MCEDQTKPIGNETKRNFATTNDSTKDPKKDQEDEKKLATTDWLSENWNCCSGVVP